MDKVFNLEKTFKPSIKDIYNNELLNASARGDLDMINFMISEGADEFNYGLYYASVKGYLNLVELMVSKGANDFNWGLYNACLGGHLNTVKYMISKGAKNKKQILSEFYDLKPEIKNYLLNL